MRGDLGKHVRKSFEKKLIARFPQFELVKGEKVSAGSRVFVWRMGPELSAYLALSTFNLAGNDAFDIRLAWTRKGRWPAYIQADPDEPEDGEVHFPLHQLWNERRPLDLWQIGPDWELEAPRLPLDDLVPRAEEAIDDALRRFAEFGLPCLAKVAAAARGAR
jgi:hypothetical protein